MLGQLLSLELTVGLEQWGEKMGPFPPNLFHWKDLKSKEKWNRKGLCNVHIEKNSTYDSVLK